MWNAFEDRMIVVHSVIFDAQKQFVLVRAERIFARAVADARLRDALLVEDLARNVSKVHAHQLTIRMNIAIDIKICEF